MERILEPEFMDDAEESKDYDAMDHTIPNSAFVDRLLELGAQGLMLDIGCGPGHIPPLIVAQKPDARVIGIDAARTMIDLAKKHLLESQAADRVSYQLANAKTLPFPDHHFDAILSNTVLHHIPNPVPFLAEALRVLKPSGVLLIRDLFRPEDMAQVDALVALHGAEANPSQRALFRASLCAALTPAELKKMAQSAGLKDFEIVTDSDRHMSLQISGKLP